MDLKTIIKNIVSKVQNDKNFAENFNKNPVDAVRSIVGSDLSTKLLNQVIDGVKAKISVDKANDLFDQAKSFFKE